MITILQHRIKDVIHNKSRSIKFKFEESYLVIISRFNESELSKIKTHADISVGNIELFAESQLRKALQCTLTRTLSKQLLVSVSIISILIHCKLYL